MVESSCHGGGCGNGWSGVRKGKGMSKKERQRERDRGKTTKGNKKKEE